VPDERDQCPDADLTLTVIVDSYDCGIDKALVVELAGCRITQAIMTLAEDSNSHGQFVSEVDKLLLELQQAEIIESNKKAPIKTLQRSRACPNKRIRTGGIELWCAFPN